MKTSVFVANGISTILLLNILLANPSLTGFAVSPTETGIDLTSPLGFAIIFIIATIAIDIYLYLKSKHLRATHKYT